MFDKKGFKSTMKDTTGNTYCYGLSRIEAMFGKSIDQEYAQDQCVNLQKMLEKALDEAAPNSQDKVNLGRYSTNLRKYIAFKKGDLQGIEGNAHSFEDSLEVIISEYKKALPTTMENERYKWEAIWWFQKNWNPDAPDFAKMLAESFSKASTLLASAMYYPLKMVTEYAEHDPETVRNLFAQLYDESIPLEIRYQDFKTAFQKRADELKKETGKNLQHYQDLRAIMVYLTFRYPEKYYFYKAKMFTAFKEKTGYIETTYSGKTIVDKINSFNHMCDQILSRVQEDPELIAMSKAQLNEQCYQDEAQHILTMDIVFYGAYYMNPPAVIDPTVIGDDPDIESDVQLDIGLNTILYGPPGTGKTYQTVIYAVAIIENKPLDAVKQEKYSEVYARYQDYKKQKRIAFTTFHQSYSYEEFIEGIRPVVSEESDAESSGNIQYQTQPGIFKEFCKLAEAPVMSPEVQSDLPIHSAANVWKVSLYGTGENEVRAECMANNHIRIGWDMYGKDITDQMDFDAGGKVVLNTFLNRVQIGDIVLSCYSATTIDAIGIVTGEYEWHDEYKEMKRVRNVKWLVKGIRENIVELNGGNTMTLSSVYRLSNITPDNVADLVEKYHPSKNTIIREKENYVFIIDEINRGNISKIFGELITLIEPAKRDGRPEGIRAILPYSRTLFGVPDNVYLLGTMNTADRSITTLDTALRRRFQFREMLPDPQVLSGVCVEDVSVSEMLTRMNRRIAALYDREHTIGHAYFIPLVKDPTIERLAGIFKNSIIPLLQEYFYDDYEKIRLVLGDNQKQDSETQFVLKSENNYEELFGSMDEDIDIESTYEINRAALDNIDSYRSI